MRIPFTKRWWFVTLQREMYWGAIQATHVFAHERTQAKAEMFALLTTPGVWTVRSVIKDCPPSKDWL